MSDILSGSQCVKLGSPCISSGELEKRFDKETLNDFHHQYLSFYMVWYTFFHRYLQWFTSKPQCMRLAIDFAMIAKIPLIIFNDVTIEIINRQNDLNMTKIYGFVVNTMLAYGPALLCARESAHAAIIPVGFPLISDLATDLLKIKKKPKAIVLSWIDIRISWRGNKVTPYLSLCTFCTAFYMNILFFMGN